MAYNDINAGNGRDVDLAMASGCSIQKAEAVVVVVMVSGCLPVAVAVVPSVSVDVNKTISIDGCGAGNFSEGCENVCHISLGQGLARPFLAVYIIKINSVEYFSDCDLEISSAGARDIVNNYVVAVNATVEGVGLVILYVFSFAFPILVCLWTTDRY